VPALPEQSALEDAKEAERQAVIAIQAAYPQKPYLKQLMDLMLNEGIPPAEIQDAVSNVKRYLPANMTIENYPPDFVQGCLIAGWPSVVEVVRQRRAEKAQESIPF
jgi:hypothetical protein